jgi:hypothetical protein
VTDFGGSIYFSRLNGADKEDIVGRGEISLEAYAGLPSELL